MHLFMRNPKTVISSSTVLENIWDPDSRAEDNTVWAYISYLLRKPEVIGADIQIRTVRGSGLHTGGEEMKSNVKRRFQLRFVLLFVTAPVILQGLIVAFSIFRNYQ